jgi:peptidoglycan L-alanyl-D-glutamate endopeptidase CwlK
MTIENLISAVQRRLGLHVDGRAGPKTWEAIHVALMAPGQGANDGAAPLDIQPVDSRSEKNIATLLPEVQPLARALVHKAALRGIQIKIINGFRTYQEQDQLYAQGRTAPGKRVTNAKGGFSNHNFAIAFDVGVFEGGKYLPESPHYKTVGLLGEELGLEWGGSWETIVDLPHFQLRPSWATECDETFMAELRRRVAEGEPLYA